MLRKPSITYLPVLIILETIAQLNTTTQHQHSIGSAVRKASSFPTKLGTILTSSLKRWITGISGSHRLFFSWPSVRLAFCKSNITDSTFGLILSSHNLTIF
jgi:hypothetical protein